MGRPMNIDLHDRDRISDTAVEVHHALFRSWSRDFLLCHPASAIELCQEVRRRLSRPDLKDEEILWTWLNAHKRGVAHSSYVKEASC